MLLRHPHNTEDCRAVSEILQRVGDKWTVLVVGKLGGGPLRFNELRAAVGGISQKMLTTTLRGLERDGFVTRTVFPTIPPRDIKMLLRLALRMGKHRGEELSIDLFRQCAMFRAIKMANLAPSPASKAHLEPALA